MEQFAADARPVVDWALTVALVLLALVATLRSHRHGSPGRWAAAAFGALAIGVASADVVELLATTGEPWLEPTQVGLILAFPYLLVRFTASFRPMRLWQEIVLGVGAVATIATVIVMLPHLEDLDDPSAVGLAVVVAALAYWLLLSSITVVRLWRAGRDQPTVARRRMRLMSLATAVLAVALLLAVAVGDADEEHLVVQSTGLLSVLAFGVGFAPPRALRLSWRSAEDEYLQRSTVGVLQADSAGEVADALLGPTQRIVGGAGAALVATDGEVVATHGDAPAIGTELDLDDRSTNGAREVVQLGERSGHLVVWTSPYTPFFGREELALLNTMGAIATLALERCELLAEERAQRASLERARQAAEEAREEAHAANLAKSEFLSRMSHELRTPLNAILGFGQLLEGAELSDEDREGVGYILKAGHHLLALINDVLDLSRIEAGTFTISLEPVQASELIDDTVALVRPQVRARSIQLSTSSVDCDTYVMTDRQRCRQVLLNLLSNAVKYNHDGGRIDIACQLAADDAMLRISVSDTGPGIAPDRLEQLFEPFERLGAESSGVEGTGLGLALTKQLVERLGGMIDVETAPGDGATFWIDLPLAEALPAGDDIQATALAHVPAGGRTLLLVEDNLANLRVVEAMLRRRPGISVLPAMQGTLALDIAAAHQPDVVVLDLHLPDLPGREVLSRLKADPRTRHIPVIIATADATPGRIRQLRDDGAMDYLTKPLDVDAFLQAIDAAVDVGRTDDPSPD